MRLEHHLVGGYVRYISPHIIIIIIIILWKRPIVKLLFPFINAHLDFVFKISISRAICIEKESERI